MLAQSATISTISGGLTASTVTTGQTQVAFIGFQVSVSGGAPASSLTFTKFDNIGCNFISSLSNIKLYRSTTSNTYGTGTFVPVGTVSTSGNTITINSLVSETIPTGSTYYYFLAADDIYSGATKYDPQIFINTGSFATATNGTTYSAWISNYVGYTFTSPTPPTVTVTAQTGGLAGATLSYGQSAAIFGFSVKVTGTTATLGQFNFNADGNTGTLQTLFGSGVLYSSATNTFNPASPGTPVGTVGFNGNNVTVSSLNEAFTVGQTKYYFLVATQIFSSYSNTDKARFYMNTSSDVVSSTGVTLSTYSNIYETSYTLSARTINYTITSANAAANGITQGTLTPGLTNIALFGFGVATDVNTTVSNFNFNNSYNQGPAQSYFNNGKLYRSNSSTFSFSTATLVTGANVSFGYDAASGISISGLNESFVAGAAAVYYFIIGDFNPAYYGALPATSQFRFLTTQSNPIVQTSPLNSNITVSSNVNGTNFNLGLSTLTVTGVNSTANGITSGALSYGQTDIVLFGFKLDVSGVFNLSQIDIQSSVSANPYFSNGRLYRSTTSNFSDATLVSGANVSFPGTYTDISNLTESFNSYTGTSTYYYFLVADFLASTSYSEGTIKYNFTNGQQTFVQGSPYRVVNNLSTTNGTNFTIGGLYDWVGTNGSSLTNKNNWRVNGSTPGSAPNQNDAIRFGVNSYQSPANQPDLTANKTYNRVTFGTNNSPALKIDAGITLTVTNGITITDGASPTIASSSASGTAATVNIGGTSTVASTGMLQLSNKITIANTGNFTFLSDAHGTGSVAALPTTASLTGTYTVQRWFTGGQPSNRGWRLMSSPVANGSGTYNFSSLQTNLYITGALGGGFDVSPANNATVLLYDTPNKKLISLPSITTGVNVGSGFYFYFRGNKTTTLGKLAKNGANYATPESNVVGLQTGTLNQQGITYTLSNAGNGFNLVGNPYASTISMPSGGGAVGNSTPYTGTTGFVYTYTPGANSVSPAVSTVNIASGQGFYVKSNNATSSIAFTESLKTTAQVTGSNFLLGKPVGTEQPLITIKMVQDSANYDIAYLRFLDTYKNEYDESEDADDLTGSGQNAFLSAMTIDAHAVAVASQPLDKKRTSIFLNVNDNYSGLYSIQKMNLSGIPEAYDVWLMDHFKSDSLDLRANDTYKFNLDKANPLTFGSRRFEIVMTKKPLPPYALVSFNGQKTGTDVLLKWNTVNEYDYTAFELQRSTDGTNFEAVRNIQSSSQGSYNFKDIYGSSNTATIYYRLKQVDMNDKVYYSNIVIITPAKGNGTFAVFPNPATNTIQFSLDQTIKLSSVRLNIFNAMGLLMKSSVFTASTGQQDVSNLIPGNYTIEVTDLNSKKAVLTGKFIKL